MKRFICGLLLVLAVCGGLYAATDVMVAPTGSFTSSGLQTSATPITSGIGVMGGLLMYTDGTNDHTLTVYDNASASSGTVLFKGTCIGANYSCVFNPAWPISYSNGIYGYITGSGTPSYIIYYDSRGQ